MAIFFSSFLGSFYQRRHFVRVTQAINSRTELHLACDFVVGGGGGGVGAVVVAAAAVVAATAVAVVVVAVL